MVNKIVAMPASMNAISVSFFSSTNCVVYRW
jgi:hypothetical protein